MNSEWLLFVLHLPSRESASRMRVWRGLRALGAGILRDGVYLVPDRPELASALEEHARTVRTAGGDAHVLRCEAGEPARDDDFRQRFDRSGDHEAWEQEVAGLMARLPDLDEARARREEAALRRGLESITGIDFFPDPSRTRRAASTMLDLEAKVNAYFSPGEPIPESGETVLRDPAGFRGRLWATRARLWVDRVASAWLIRRHIDPAARFAWIPRPSECPPEAVGFDFDGAEFSHQGERVTFQVLAAAFALDRDPALARLGELVRYLDVGGAPVAEAAGVLALLGAARQRSGDDDAFLESASALLDDLYTAFTGAPGTGSRTDAG